MKTKSCFLCKKIFEPDCSDEDAIREFEIKFNRKPTKGELGRPVCDSCYHMVLNKIESEKDYDRKRIN